MACFGGGVTPEQRRAALEDNSPLGAYLSSDELSELVKCCNIASIKRGKDLPESPFCAAFCIKPHAMRMLSQF